MSKKYKLSHTPIPQDNSPASPKEEKEMMKDMLLSNIEMFTAEEIAQSIREGIVTMKEVEEVCSPSNC